MKEYISSLDDFALSIALLAESIKENISANKNNSNESTISNSAAMYKEVLLIAESLTEVKEITTEVKSNTDAILEELKVRRKEETTTKKKEKGIFSFFKKGGTTAKEMAQGIQTVVMMAGSIVAIGAAFQLIGKVDFTSVLSLSLALPLVAYSFEKIGQLKMDVRDYMRVSVGMILMSSSLAISANIIKDAPTLTFSQFFSLIGVSVGLGITMYAMSRVLEYVSLRDISDMVALSLIMPLISSNLVSSAQILQQMPNVSFKTAISAGLTGIAMGAAIIPLAFAAKLMGGPDAVLEVTYLSLISPFIMSNLVSAAQTLQEMPNISTKTTLSALATSVAIGAAMISLAFAYSLSENMTMKDWFLLTLSMPVIAAGIVVTSKILSNLNDINMKTEKVIEYSLGSALAILAYGGSMALMNKFGLGLKEAALGSVAMVAISGAILASSWLLSFGNYENGPTYEWSLGVAMGLIGTMPAILAYGAIAATGFGALVIGAGILSLLGVATGIVAVSHILAKGNYSGGPSEAWAKGVGLSILAFSEAISLFDGGGIMGAISSFFGGKSDNMLLLKNIAKTMNEVAGILQSGTYSGGPSEEWAKGVGQSIRYFAEAVSLFKPGLIGTLLEFMGAKSSSEVLMDIVKVMKDVNTELGGTVFAGGPNEAWAKGVGLSIKYFAESIALISDEIGPDEAIKYLPTIKALAYALPSIGASVATGTYTKVPSSSWSKDLATFINEMMGIRYKTITDDNISVIYKLSTAFGHLSISLRKFSKSLWSLNGAPDLSSVYNGMALISVIDPTALNMVLNSVNEQELKVKKIVSVFDSNSSTGTSQTNGDKKSIAPAKGRPNKKTEGNINPENQNTKKKDPQVIVPPAVQTNILLNKMIKQNIKIIENLTLISGNTETKKEGKFK